MDFFAGVAVVRADSLPDLGIPLTRVFERVRVLRALGRIRGE
jgi:hypothetical protein